VKRLVVLISGSGSNLQALIDAIQQGTLNAEIALVVSNRKEAYGLVRAQNAGIRTAYLPFKPYREQGREAYDSALAELIEPAAPDLIVLAGWMHILTPVFLMHFPNRVINLHPALPGAFPGINAIQRSFEAYQQGNVTQGGVMVHYVIPEVDAGEVIVQEGVPIQPDDTLATFEARLHQVEHRLLVEAVRRV
jgi:formyltetrahydrofolate-dependent phosphoribosylglycinamide formyltransferase